MARGNSPITPGTQGPRPNARFGNTSRAASLGMPLTGKVKGGGVTNMNRIGNSRNVQQGGRQGSTRPITPGTKAPVGRSGSTQRRTRGVQ